MFSSVVFGFIWISTNPETGLRPLPCKFVTHNKSLHRCCSGKSRLARLAFSSLHFDCFQGLEIDFSILRNDPEQTGSALEGNGKLVEILLSCESAANV